MDRRELRESEIRVEEALSSKYNLVELAEDYTLSYMQYRFLDALKGFFPGCTVYQSAGSYKLHVETLLLDGKVVSDIKKLIGIHGVIGSLPLRVDPLQKLYLDTATKNVLVDGFVNV